MKDIKPLVLIILDGWGIAPESPGNAVKLAQTPNFDRFWSAYPHTQLLASGEAVGLPRGEDGNSETGHLNLGAGKIVFQDLLRINMAIASENFNEIQAFKNAFNHLKKNQSKLHLMGLVGAGGVHSSLEHLFALLYLAKKAKLKKVFLHLFTDGRDSAPSSAMTYLSQVVEETKKLGLGKIASLCGRYFAMDRDHRWNRTQKTYELLVAGKGETARTVSQAIQRSYQKGKTDEFLEPVLLDPDGLVENHDTVIFFNFRIDRPRQLTKAFVLPDFENLETKRVAFDPYAEKYGLKQYESPEGTTSFKRSKVLKDLFFVTMTEYEKNLPVEAAFPPEKIPLPLARILAENHKRQLHLAETEKERFVTYYFNGQREDPFAGEDRIEIPSPGVATYDLKPEMAAWELTETLIKRISLDIYDFILVNYANPDMVGHTGVLPAGIKACEVVDSCLGKVVKNVLGKKGTLIVTADHGNVEEMIDLQTGQVDTKHSTNPVPFILIDEKIGQKSQNLSLGILADVAPTILNIMGLSKPSQMTGRNLL